MTNDPAPARETPCKPDKLLGLKQGAKQIEEVLKVRWPTIFADPKNIRPLASSVTAQIAAELGWSYAYARAVMSVWKSRSAYCNAILRHDIRVNLDGSPSNETVDAQARRHAKDQLERIAARKAREQQRAAAALQQTTSP